MWIEHTTVFVDSIMSQKESSLEELKQKTAEEIATELLEILRKEFPEAIGQNNILSVALRGTVDVYLSRKGFETIYEIPDAETRLKILRAETVALARAITSSA